MSLPIKESCPLIDTNLISIHSLFQENSNSEKDLRASILGINRGDNLFIPKIDGIIGSESFIEMKRRAKPMPYMFS